MISYFSSSACRLFRLGEEEEAGVVGGEEVVVFVVVVEVAAGGEEEAEEEADELLVEEIGESVGRSSLISRNASSVMRVRGDMHVEISPDTF